MKTFQIFLIAVLSGSACFSAYSQSPEKGKIKSLVVLEERSDVLVKKPLKESETYYDEKGNVIEEIEYKQGKVDKHFRYKYDEEGNKILEEDLDPSGKLREYSEYKIENGLRVEKIVYDPDKKIKLRKIYQYTMFDK
ncbi:MAG TPA: hypothetical protein VK155_06770 [Bacteroidales bacterium]|jgi:antitoxin component YwqK of YwqJK toxin-antitoxin module|nr:hypothetical protein [Bacteroidales bacterium]